MTEAELDTLLEKMSRLAEMFERAASGGYPSGRYAAEAIQRRRDDLVHRVRGSDALVIASRLLDIVPTAKDLDAIGFDLRRHPEIRAMLGETDILAAEFSGAYLGEGDE